MLRMDFAIHAWPFILRPVAVEFDAVAIRVAQVNGFTHTVVGCTLKGTSVVEEALERARQFSPVRIENREVIKPRAAGRRLRRPFARPGVKANVVMIATR